MHEIHGKVFNGKIIFVGLSRDLIIKPIFAFWTEAEKMYNESDSITSYRFNWYEYLWWTTKRWAYYRDSTQISYGYLTGGPTENDWFEKWLGAYHIKSVDKPIPTQMIAKTLHEDVIRSHTISSLDWQHTRPQKLIIILVPHEKKLQFITVKAQLS